MKKIIYISTIFIFLIFPIKANATSGCCSHHGGVNCNKIQSNGNVVCNDGWLGSTCSYDSMDMCSSYTPIASNSSTTNPTNTANYNYGCTDSNAANYDSTANKSDGSCVYYINGCTDPKASNFNSKANKDDGSCKYLIYGCTDEKATNYDMNANTDDNSCTYQQKVSINNTSSSKIKTSDTIDNTNNNKSNTADGIIGLSTVGGIGAIIAFIIKKKH